MDQLLFHPKVVHLPMALAVLLPLVGGGVLFAWWRGWFQRRVWVVVLLLQATLVGSGVVAMNTGEREEERVEEIVAEEQIEAHEEAAEAFVWAAAAVLLLMALPLVLPEGRARQAVSLGAFLGTLIVLGLGYKAGEAGGRLVYQHGAAQTYVANGGDVDVGPASGDSPEGDSDSH
ncbi:MAG: hypothetical protein DRH23_01915 [Deltaproteobacteria bacterium]|nr:hypothetical protein [Deltaproteobacteria bacterium]MBW2403775.1 hypothetical protein [Deltaproteobacteria bacterium]RLB51551.1 MAG: hypothetical protein DRH23_01915 [Deltaproteobacteria bacterium]